MRKREADGQTNIYLNHCEKASPQADQQGRKNESRIVISNLGLQPQRTGVVEYDAMSEVLYESSPLLTQSQPVRISLRDGKEQLMPSIDIKVPLCAASQLQMSGEPVRLGQHWDTPNAYADPGQEWHHARVYEFTNISDQTCLLGGVPGLRFLQAPGRGAALMFHVCANCATPLFQPRLSEWIDLKPHDSAHFLVGTKALDQDYWWLCNLIGEMDLTFPDPRQVISVPFAAATCGQVRVSAWRAGKYDGDLRNATYQPEKSQQLEKKNAPTPLPRECRGADLTKLGRPLMFKQRDGVLFGLSAGTRRIVYGNQVPIYLWIVNQSNKPQSFSSCEDIGGFWDHGFDVYDAHAHRVLKLSEQKGPQQHVTANLCNIVSVCTANMVFSVPEHTCSKPEQAYNLAESYVLTPGEYVLAPRSQLDCTDPTRIALPTKEPPGLVISVEPQ